jgi:hypothetical protein
MGFEKERCGQLLFLYIESLGCAEKSKNISHEDVKTVFSSFVGNLHM